jgi:4-hydroxy-L-threonine phosphate dehydrogenase PdxA
MKIAVVDGQGGGIGRHITERMRKELPEDVEIIALGTNALATSLMLKAGANEGATGENAVVQNAGEVDLIVGSIAVALAHSMLGELTPAMAEAVAKSKARKILLPLNRSGVEIVGVKMEPLPHMIEELVKSVKKYLEGENYV